MNKNQAINYLSKFNIETIENMQIWEMTRLLESIAFIKEQLAGYKYKRITS